MLLHLHLGQVHAILFDKITNYECTKGFFLFPTSKVGTLHFFLFGNFVKLDGMNWTLRLLNNECNYPDWHVAPSLTKEFSKKAAKLCVERGANLGK